MNQEMITSDNDIKDVKIDNDNKDVTIDNDKEDGKENIKDINDIKKEEEEGLKDVTKLVKNVINNAVTDVETNEIVKNVVKDIIEGFLDEHVDDNVISEISKKQTAEVDSIVDGIIKPFLDNTENKKVENKENLDNTENKKVENKENTENTDIEDTDSDDEKGPRTIEDYFGQLELDVHLMKNITKLIKTIKVPIELLLCNRWCSKFFLHHLRKQYAAENLLFYITVEDFKRATGLLPNRPRLSNRFVHTNFFRCLCCKFDCNCSETEKNNGSQIEVNIKGLLKELRGLFNVDYFKQSYPLNILEDDKVVCRTNGPESILEQLEKNMAYKRTRKLSLFKNKVHRKRNQERISEEEEKKRQIALEEELATDKMLSELVARLRFDGEDIVVCLAWDGPLKKRKKKQNKDVSMAKGSVDYKALEVDVEPLETPFGSPLATPPKSPYIESERASPSRRLSFTGSSRRSLSNGKQISPSILNQENPFGMKIDPKLVAAAKKNNKNGKNGKKGTRRRSMRNVLGAHKKVSIQKWKILMRHVTIKKYALNIKAKYLDSATAKYHVYVSHRLMESIKSKFKKNEFDPHMFTPIQSEVLETLEQDSLLRFGSCQEYHELVRLCFIGIYNLLEPLAYAFNGRQYIEKFLAQQKHKAQEQLCVAIVAQLQRYVFTLSLQNPFLASAFFSWIKREIESGDRIVYFLLTVNTFKQTPFDTNEAEMFARATLIHKQYLSSQYESNKPLQNIIGIDTLMNVAKILKSQKYNHNIFSDSEECLMGWLRDEAFPRFFVSETFHEILRGINEFMYIERRPKELQSLKKSLEQFAKFHHQQKTKERLSDLAELKIQLELVSSKGEIPDGSKEVEKVTEQLTELGTPKSNKKKPQKSIINNIELD